MGEIVTLHVCTHRFVCHLPRCRRRIFTERLPALMAPSARRTRRAQEQVQHIEFNLGGRPGVRHARREGMPVSRRTLLRVLRAMPLPTAGSVRVLEIDDWAQRARADLYRCRRRRATSATPMTCGSVTTGTCACPIRRRTVAALRVRGRSSASF